MLGSTVTTFRESPRNFVRLDANHEISWRFRPIPSLLILLRSVFGWRFRILAAPFGPSITPADRFKAARI